MIPLILTCGAVMLASLSGKLFVWRSVGALLERNLHFMVSFATGIFLLFAWQLGAEVFAHMSVAKGLLFVAGGAIAVTLVSKWLSHDGEAYSHLDARRMLVSDSIHNIGDGIVLAATFAVSPMFGIVATLSIFVHEVVQETAEFFVLRDAGYSTRRALLLNFATSSTILLGAIGGWFVFGLFESMEGILLAVALGGVLSVVFYDLLPHSFAEAREQSTFWKHLFWFVLGAILMYGVTVLLPHKEPEYDGGERTGVVHLTKWG